MDPVDNVAQNTSMAGFSLVIKRKIVFHLIYHYLPAGEGGGAKIKGEHCELT